MKRLFLPIFFSIMTVGGLLLVSIIFLTWTRPLSIALPPPPGDITSVLLGAASLMMTIFALFVAVAGLLGWQGLKEKVVDEAEKAAREAIDKQYKVGYGRLKLGIGTVYGLIAEYLRDERPSRNWGEFFLHAALGETRVAYPLLAKSEYEWKAKNNFAFQLAMQGAVEDATEALALARYLRQAASEGQATRAALLTYARVISVFASTAPEGEDLTQEAVEIMQNVATAPSSSQLIRDEAAEEIKRLLNSLEHIKQQPRPKSEQDHPQAPDEPALLARQLFRALWRKISAKDQRGRQS